MPQDIRNQLPRAPGSATDVRRHEDHIRSITDKMLTTLFTSKMPTTMIVTTPGIAHGLTQEPVLLRTINLPASVTRSSRNGRESRKDRRDRDRSRSRHRDPSRHRSRDRRDRRNNSRKRSPSLASRIDKPLESPKSVKPDTPVDAAASTATTPAPAAAAADQAEPMEETDDELTVDPHGSN